MNLTDKLKELVAKQTALLNKAMDEKRGMSEEETTSFNSIQKEVEGVKAAIDAQEKMAATNAMLNAPDPMQHQTLPTVNVTRHDPRDEKPFKNIAEQLNAIQTHARTGVCDERLLKVQNASGAAAGVGADGGFAIQKDFGGAMMESAVKDDPLLSLIESFPVSAKSDRVSWQELAEDNVGTTVFGGIRAYWASEGGTVAATKPQMREQELKLEKLMGFYYNTMELEGDSSFNSSVVTKGFTAAIRRELAAAVYSGDGVGKPLGMLNSPGLVSVAKEGGQNAATVVWENISKMYNRARGAKSDFVWLIHPDVLPQLENMVKVIGTGGVPVYLPSALPDTLDTLRGRRIYESDQCQTLGTKGDIMLVNPKEYVLLYKGGIETASSIHVGFLTAENCFRFIFRCNGFPKQRSALTIKNSAATRSSIISLDTRS